MTQGGGEGEECVHKIWNHYKANMMFKVWYWHTAEQVEQWNRTESLAINLNTHGNSVYEKYGILNQWGGAPRCSVG